MLLSDDLYTEQLLCVNLPSSDHRYFSGVAQSVTAMLYTVVDKECSSGQKKEWPISQIIKRSF